MDQPVDLLAKYTALAKDIIYNADRFSKLRKMMGSPQGAVLAVKTVLGAIEQAKPIPPELARNLAVNTYLVLVDMAQAASEQEDEVPVKASPEKMKQVIGMLLKETNLTHGPGAQQGAQPPQGQPPAPPQGGILAQGAM
jgi:hypothetical protein